ncbi:glycosyltransferase family 2 protein [Alkanindiges illinoisensis]|uniref:glycosyltransferase family 2 protein n=1 Tax=Alkanindiges illinoisensis TaxID=197183 RepID=UPI00047DB6C7|nr:glycosyltransferase family 2 protein [Alkanindiges illinoisensis]
MNNIAAITVTYNPSFELLTQQMHSLGEIIWIIVDNGSNAQDITRLSKISQKRNNIYLVNNNENLGLATALNIGVNHAIKMHKTLEFILLLDQDSVPATDAINQLYKYFNQLEENGSKVGCVGPKLIDFKTQKQHGFHQMRNGLWSRIYPESGSIQPVKCTNINGSGTFMRANLFTQLGALDQDFFIDHIDTEWSFRVLNAGYHLYGIPTAVFYHQMGESSLKFWLFGWKVWPIRSAFRHFYLFRNTILLLFRKYVPLTWKFWAIIKLILTFIVYLIFSIDRKTQARSMLKGAGAAFKYPK